MANDQDAAWPELSYPRDHHTFETLHLMTQIVGKVRLALTPWVNHSWQVPLYVTARGLSTSLMPHPAGQFDLEFDFLDGRLVLRTEAGRNGGISLAPGSIAAFYAAVMELLDRNGVPTKIFAAPNELPEQIPFYQDTASRAYDSDAALRFWRALLKVDAVLKHFRSAFLGKVSPVHFFWGSFDLAVTRFSGHRAPLHPGGVPHLPDDVAREAYSHEVSSAGFWTGAANKPFALFYSYAYPEPTGFREALATTPARYDSDLGEYVLPYDDVRQAKEPQRMLLDFLQSTYAAAAENASWDRALLECQLGEPRQVRKV